ncbi:MAG: hypothetical protein IT364_12270 [Candidatus Hydrogenedentes bacterium]|nr:hypothetical protein [Candidatus Hydrogenedentota bacterium]
MRRVPFFESTDEDFVRGFGPNMSATPEMKRKENGCTQQNEVEKVAGR